VFALVPRIPEKRAVPPDRRPMLLPLFFSQSRGRALGAGRRETGKSS
jgi:hypothetical protein